MLHKLFRNWFWGLVIAGAIGLYGLYDDNTPPDSLAPPAVVSNVIQVSDYIDDNRADYILYGDDYDGGGHKYGVGKPCKSEFPDDWSDDKVLREIALIAANDNLPWKKEGNGYHVVEHITDGVRIRVVNNRERGSVVTAYPKNTPRNPCPRGASNDR